MMAIMLFIFFACWMTQGIIGTSACVDNASEFQCKSYKGLCRTNTWVKSNCKKTCGICSGPVCTDDKICKRYSKSYCKYNWWKMNCKNYCGLCSASTTSKPRTTKMTPSANPNTKPPNTPVPGNCGIPSITQSRVIAGENSKAGQWPWQIAMLKNGRFSCGGSLITPEWVVTAAHCIDRTTASTLKVVLGDLDRRSSSKNEQTIQVARIVKHASYNRPSRFNNDIALLKLSKPAKLNRYVRTVCLPDQGAHIASGSKCFISGWGKISHPGTSTTQLQHASLTILSKSECSRRNRRYGIITDAMVCGANAAPHKQSGCHGDSGGPFVCQESNGSWKLHGAVSWGSPTCNINDASTVFARVSALRSWIDEQMRKY